MRIWELIRVQDAPVTLQQLVSATGLAGVTVQEHVDELVRQGLLRPVRARKPRKQVGWRTARERIVIGFDEGSPEIERRLREWAERSFAEWSNTVQHLADTDTTTGDGSALHFFGLDHLAAVDLDELQRRIRSVCDYWRMLGAKTSGTPSMNGGVRERRCNHAVHIRMQPLKNGPLALPHVQFVTNREIERAMRSPNGTVSLNGLAPRERAVARAMALGNSCKQVAAQLGISSNTVGTLAKRAFAKMGVRKASELAARMAGLQDRL